MDEMPPQEPSFNPPPANPSPATPPPLLTQPPIIAVPPKVKAKTGRGWKIVAVVALVLLALSLWGKMTRVASVFTSSQSGRAAVDGERRLEEFYVERKNTENKIVLVDVQGNA